MGILKQVIQKGWPRQLIDEQDPLGKIIHELQDVVDAHDVVLTGGGDIGDNAAAIAALQAAATTDEGHITTNTTNIATNTSAIAVLVAAGMDSLLLSFDTGESGTVKLYFPKTTTITTVRLFVTKALAATDAGTVTLKNSSGTGMAGGVGTVPLSSVFGTEVLITPTDHNSVAAGDFIELVSAKTTAGGKLLATVFYTITP